MGFGRTNKYSSILEMLLSKHRYSMYSMVYCLDAVVFVVDSADTDRIPIAKTELMAILNVSDCTASDLFSRKKN